MNRKKLSMAWIALGLAMSLLVGCGGPSTTKTEGTVTKIEGTVTLNGDVGKPIANVEVFLVLTADPEEDVARTTTDSQGKYSFEDVGPGNYMVGAAVRGRCSVVIPDVTVSAGATAKVDLDLSCTP